MSALGTFIFKEILPLKISTRLKDQDLGLFFEEC